MHKNRFHTEFTEKQLLDAKCYMLEEIAIAPKEYQEQLIDLFYHYWRKFLNGDFSVDGATFIAEETGCFFNIWWFIHDARNSDGYVGKAIDNEMIDIMTLTNTPSKYYRQAVPLLCFTFVNVIRHYFKGTLKSELPNNLIVINEQ